nr:pre-peptidase C-terminal domain-containing protein [uncultured Desulfobulbus sp.]
MFSRKSTRLFSIFFFLVYSITVGILLLYSSAVAASYDLGHEFTVEELKSDSSGVCDFMADIIDDLEDDINFASNTRKWLHWPTDQERAEYLQKLGSKAISSFITLRAENNYALGNLGTQTASEYYNLIFQLEKVLVQLLAYPTERMSFSTIYSLQTSGKLSSDFFSKTAYHSVLYSSLDGLGNYYYTMVAYRLLHILPMHEKMSDGTIFGDIESDIESLSDISYEEKQALYNIFADTMKSIFAYEFGRTPKIPDINAISDDIDNTSIEVVDSSRDMIHGLLLSEYWGLAGDWFNASSDLVKGLVNELISRTLLAISVEITATSEIDTDEQLYKYLEGVEISLGQLIDESSGYAEVSRCTAYPNQSCLGSSETGAWPKFVWESYSGGENVIFYIPPEAEQRLNNLKAIMSHVQDRANASTHPPNLSFTASARSVAEADGRYLTNVLLLTTDGVATGEPFSVDIVMKSGSAEADADFYGTKKTVTFPTGTTSGTILQVAIPIYADLEDEADETFTIRLENPSGGASLSSPSSTTVTISDSASSTLWKERQTKQYLYGAAYGNGLYVTVGSSGAIMISQDGLQWEIRASGTDKTLNAVTYGNGRFMAVGENGTACYSDDGLNWQCNSLGDTSTDLNGVAFGNGLFVAVDDAGEIWSSTTGESWTQKTNGTGALYAITYGNDCFLTVGYQGQVMTSSDGINWTSRTANTTATLYSLIYAGGQFLAAGNYGEIHCSPDGITWTSNDTNDSSSIRSIAHDGSLYVAVGYTGNIFTSPDGVSWTKRLDLNHYLSTVVYGNGKFVTVGSSGEVLTSTNGIDWSEATTATTATLYSLIYAGGQFLAAGNYGEIHCSPDGITWTSNDTNDSSSIRSIAHDGSLYVAVGYTGNIFTSPDGVSWTKRLDLNHYLSTVVYGNGKFVTVGSSGEVLTSSNGINWSEATTATTNYLYGVTYGNGTFVAVGANGTIQTSTNGTVWALRTTDATETLNSVAYGLGVFVAVGDNGTVIRSVNGADWEHRDAGTADLNCISAGTSQLFAAGDNGVVLASTDGRTWLEQTVTSRNIYAITAVGDFAMAVGQSGLLLTVGKTLSSNSSTDTSASLVWTPRQTNQYLHGAAYENGLYVTVGSSGAIMISQDGLQWEIRASGTDKTLNAVTYGNGRFMAVGENGTACYSDDGLNWQCNSLGDTSTDLNGVAFGNGLFVAVDDAGEIWSSTTGESWTQKTNGTGALYAITYGNDCFLTVGYQGQVMTSSDGINWTSRTANTTATLYSLIYAGGQFLAAGNYGEIHCSPDGITWTSNDTNDSSSIRSIAHDGSLYVAVGYTGNIFTSPDGVSWTKRLDLNHYLSTVVYGNGKFVTVGSSGEVLTSTNGIDWSEATTATTATLYSLIYAGGQFLAAGNYGEIHCSPDGITWTSNDTNDSSSIRSIAHDGSLYVAVGYTGNIFTSPDGVSWTKRLDLNHYLSTVVYGNGKFVTVGSSGEVLTSSNGINWSEATTATTNYLYGVTYGNGTFVAVGANGTIQTSTNGTVWTLRTTDATETLNSVAYGLGVFVAGGENGSVTRSVNGVDWYYEVVSDINVNSISFGALGFVAVGDEGRYFQSTDLGRTWLYGETEIARDFYSICQVNGIAYVAGGAGLFADTGVSSEEGEGNGLPRSLNSGQIVGPFSGEEDSERFFSLEIPPNTTKMTWWMYGGDGDGDLYVRQGSRPNELNFDYRPYTDGNTEIVTVQNPDSGTWYGMIYGWEEYNNVYLYVEIEQETVYPLTVSKVGSGTITSTNRSGIAFGSDNSENYDPGTEVVLKASPAAGWQFSKWGGNASGISDTCTVTMTSAKQVTATFVEKGLNSPPEWNEIPDQILTVGQTWSYTLSATDSEDNLTYSLLTTGAVTLSGSTLRWTPTSANVGFQRLKVQVFDGVNSPVTAFIHLYVNPLTNKAPLVSQVGDIVASPGGTITFQVVANDPNSDDEVSISLLGTLPDGATFENNTFQWTPGYNQRGSYSFTFVASDGTLSTNMTVQVTVDKVFSIISAAEENGIIFPTGKIWYPQGTNQTYTIAADQGYLVADVIVDDVSIGPVEKYTFSAIGSDHTIVVNFEIDPNANALKAMSSWLLLLLED